MSCDCWLGGIVGDGQYSDGSIISTVITKPENNTWSEFNVDDSIDVSASIVYSILDSDNNILKTVSDGMSISDITVDSLKIMANLSTTDMTKMPKINSWQLTYL